MAGTWERVAILGPGLLGGSIGLAIKERGLGEVRFWGRSEKRLTPVREAGFFASSNLPEVIEGVDLVILATPVGFFQELANQLVEIGGDFVVTDVGSVKAQVHEGAGRILAEGGIEFIGGHPMAGSERCGFGEARSDLLEDAPCLVTEGGQSRPETTTRMLRFWESLGCLTKILPAKEHDQVVARISHLPHVLAAVAATVGMRKSGEGALSGGGLRDTTRVAGGDPAMWRGILMENREAVVGEIERSQSELTDLKKLLAEENSEGVEDWLTKAKKRRDSLEK